MLRWFVLFTLALLPWLAWAGPGASASGASHARSAAHAHTDGAECTDPHGGVHADCLDHEQLRQDHEEDTHAGGDLGDCPTCSACQACSPAALLTTFTLPQPPRFDTAPTIAAPRRFASADQLPGFKPPIP